MNCSENNTNKQERKKTGDLPPLPRRLTTAPLPAYSYVPGMHPHPLSHPQGHLCVSPFDPDEANGGSLQQQHAWAVDLFNAGFYWEAHEAWEAMWICFGRRGEEADFTKGLIKLAAAGVKARVGSTTGVARHARRAVELFSHLEQTNSSRSSRFGLQRSWLVNHSQRLADDPDAVIDTTRCQVRRVMPFVLEPRTDKFPDPLR